MNEPLGTAAKLAPSDPQVEYKSGFCQRAVRQLIAKLYKSRFAAFNKGASAIEAAKNWEKSPFAVDPRRGSVVGDIMYWTQGHGPHGHVGIRVPGNKVFSNTTLSPSARNAKCLLPLAAFGEPDLLVRLPPP